MYGCHVHEAVAAAGERETGITIHLVNERYDEGRVIFQASTPLEPGDTPETIEAKVHQLERRHFTVARGFLKNIASTGMEKRRKIRNFATRYEVWF